jgi:hypothetical protein
VRLSTLEIEVTALRSFSAQTKALSPPVTAFSRKLVAFRTEFCGETASLKTGLSRDLVRAPFRLG